MSLSALYWALYESIVLCRTTKGEYLDTSKALLKHSNIYHLILLHPHVTPKGYRGGICTLPELQN
eukprot:COSAG01_NODE_6935_length_3432_cov_3.466247_1_plen_65_part_00